MAERSGSGHPVQSWSGSARAWSDVPVVHGALRISGTALDSGASWYVTTDRLGWSSVTLLSDPLRQAWDRQDWDAAATLRRCAEASLDPVETALAVRDRLRRVSRERCRTVGLAVARFGPEEGIVELINVSLPTVLYWDPVEGISPYEPIFADLDSMTNAASSEMLRLHPGAALVLATQGVLPRDATWSALASFVRALGLDPFGGTVADAPPSELARLLRSSWGCGAGPSAMVIAGHPSLGQQVA